MHTAVDFRLPISRRGFLRVAGLALAVSEAEYARIVALLRKERAPLRGAADQLSFQPAIITEGTAR